MSPEKSKLRTGRSVSGRAALAPMDLGTAVAFELLSSRLHHLIAAREAQP
ncbi:hypothetical protein [Streptomyces hesseae]|uniref:Uncharacterized protein n=1 Tax=Streptomyces hesseae TaxID=3075519 RepID=A0ABU2SHB5_9ACTN|nr:hypothetical protein [Streptomyces sp. DSM 40473]MDT0448373.1 hypothetical protein [Streptomyces sp. DSM 40473]